MPIFKVAHTLLHFYVRGIILEEYIKNPHLMPKSINFTETELETIERAMDDYMCYHDDDTPASDLIGGLPVAERVNDIMFKITEAYANL